MITTEHTTPIKHNLYAREAAHQIGVSEADIIANGVGADLDNYAVRLTPAFPAIMSRIETLGRVTACTRNADAIHEKNGTYKNLQLNGQTGIALGKEIDLRIFYQHWAHGFAVIETADQITHRSLQFFDASGDAVHKIYLGVDSNIDAFQHLLNGFSDSDQTPGMQTEAPPALPIARDDSAIDLSGLRDAWRAMTNTHQFFGLLDQFKVQRHQALRLVGPEFAVPVEADSVRRLLQCVAADATPIMVFTGSRGMIQIHSGAVQHIEQNGEWLQIRDDGFHFHLRQDRIASAWVVKKPTSDGIITSLELFDAQHENNSMLFGLRKQGKPELSAWRDAIAQLPLLSRG